MTSYVNPRLGNDRKITKMFGVSGGGGGASGSAGTCKVEHCTFGRLGNGNRGLTDYQVNTMYLIFSPYLIMMNTSLAVVIKGTFLSGYYQVHIEHNFLSLRTKWAYWEQGSGDIS